MRKIRPTKKKWKNHFKNYGQNLFSKSKQLLKGNKLKLNEKSSVMITSQFSEKILKSEKMQTWCKDHKLE